MLKLSTKLYDEPTNPFEGYGIKECDELAKIYDDLSSAIERIYPKMNVWCIDPFIDYLNNIKEMHAQIDEFEKAKEEAIKEYNKALNGETFNASKIMYEYLDDPKDHIDYFNEEDYAVLQERLVELQK